MAERSIPNQGQICGIYLLGPAKELCDDVVRGYNQTAMCAGAGEDFADCHWPVVVKAKADVTREDLVQHLRDLADAVVGGGYFVEVDEKARQTHPQDVSTIYEPF